MSIVKESLQQHGAPETFRRAREVARKYIFELRQAGRISFSENAAGCHPSVHVARRTVPEAWEDTTMALLAIGSEIHTHYDPRTRDGRYESFPSLEATVMMRIEEPFAEPRFHKHYLGGWLGFGDYRAEIEGAKDGWMISPELVAQKMRDGSFDEIRSDERWNYTYSQRLRAYHYFDYRGELKRINQLQSVIENLKREPTSRSAQCITWDPRWDHNDGQMGFVWNSYHSPCLQRLWFRLHPLADASPSEKPAAGYILSLNSHWRSRDHLKAVPSNIFGILEGIYERVRIELEKAMSVPILRGPYTDISDSLHLYGHYLDPRLQGLDAEAYLEDVFRIASGEPIEQRVIMPGTPMHEIMMSDIEAEYGACWQKVSSSRQSPA